MSFDAFISYAWGASRDDAHALGDFAGVDSKSTDMVPSVPLKGILVLRRLSLLILLCLAMAMVASAASAQGATWSENGYNPGHSGYNPLETTIATTNAQSLSVTFSSSTSSRPTSQLLVADQKVIFTAGSFVYAIDANSGVSRWGGKPTCDGADSGAPIVQSGIVWFGDAAGYVTGISLANGAQVGCRFLGGAVGDLTGANGVIFAHTSAGDVIALHATTGALKWARRALLPAAASPSQVALDSGIVYAIASNRFVALKAANGAVLHSKDLGFTTTTLHPVAAGGKVYILGADADDLIALNVTTGRIAWTFPKLGADGFAVAGNVVYVANEDPQFGLFAVNASTGHMIWRANLEDELFSQPTVANGVVYINSDNAAVGGGGPGEFAAVDAKTGVIVGGSAPTNGYYDSLIAPTVVNGTLYEPVVTDYRDPTAPGAIVALRP